MKNFVLPLVVFGTLCASSSLIHSVARADETADSMRSHYLSVITRETPKITRIG